MAAPFRLTPQQLLEHLASSGRVVFPRVLTDWRAKGLLPELKETGRGRGSGKLQYWDDPAVLGQAIILHDTLAGKRRADYARWVLWFCGYNVDPHLVRKYWLGYLKRRRLFRIAEPGELPADKYTAEIEHLASGLSTEHKMLSAPMAQSIAREIIIAENEQPNGPIIEEEFGELFDAAQEIVEKFNQEKGLDISISRELFRDLLRLFRSVVSVAALERTLENASSEELLRAQGYLKATGSLMRALASASQMGQYDEFKYLGIRRHFAPVFSRWVYETYLLIMKSGQEAILRSALPIAARIEAGIRDGATNPASPHSGKREFSDLFSTFKDLDWRKLYSPK